MSDSVYNAICTERDVMREHYIYGASLAGYYDFPVLDQIKADIRGLTATPYNLAQKAKKPQDSILHFFIDDYRFESVWNNPEKIVETLKKFRYVCSPDFSVYSNMPMAMQIWNVYRSRAISKFLWNFGIDVIPTVTWSGEKSYEFCFDGLPKNSTLAVSTNGCHSIRARGFYKRGFEEMCRRLKPCNVLVVGNEIKVDTDVEIVYLDAYKATNVGRKS